MLTNQFAWTGEEVFVTGATGFIGGHLMEELVRRGARVRAFIRYSSIAPEQRLEFLPNRVRESIAIHLGDISDSETVRAAMRGATMVVHLAALIGIPYSYIASRSYAKTNIDGTLNVLLAARDEEVKRILHVSTSETYGTAQRIPMDESHPVRPQSPYAASKASADLLVESFHRTFELPVVTARPFNTYGPRQSRRAVIPTIITQALAGNEIILGATDTRRDFTYVSDTVAGLLALAEHTDVTGQVVNLGSGKEASIEQVLEIVGRLLGRELTVQRSEERFRPEESEVDRLLCDNTKAKRLLDWTPKVSLEEGLEKAIAWYRDHRLESAARYAI